MPHHPTKKQRLEGRHQSAAADCDFYAVFGDLGVDELADIFSFLSLKDIMRKRRINKKTREAVKMTIVPPTDLICVDSMENYNAMSVMTTELPNLQQITLCAFKDERDEIITY